MTKYLIITLMLIIALTVTGCDSTVEKEKLDYTAKEIVELLKNKDFYKKNNYSYSIIDEKVVTEKESEESQTIKETINVLKKKDKSGKVSYKVSIEQESDGASLQATTYYTDGYGYTEYSNQKKKIKITEDEFLSDFHETGEYDPLGKVSVEDIVSINVNKDSETKIITVVIDSETFSHKLWDEEDDDESDLSEISFTLKIFISRKENIEKIEFQINTRNAFSEGELYEFIAVTFKESAAFELPDLSGYLGQADVIFEDTELDTKGQMADESFKKINGDMKNVYSFLVREMVNGYSEEYIFEKGKFAYEAYIQDGKTIIYFDGDEWYKGIKKQHREGNSYVTDSYESKPVMESEALNEIALLQLLSLGEREFVGSGKLKANIAVVEDIFQIQEFIYEEYRFPGFQESIYFLYNEKSSEEEYIYYENMLYVFRVNDEETSYINPLEYYEWYEKRFFDDVIEKAFIEEELSQIAICKDNDSFISMESVYTYSFFKNKILYCDSELNASYYFNGTDWYKEEERQGNEYGFVYVKTKLSDIQIRYLPLAYMNKRSYICSGEAADIETKAYYTLKSKYADYAFPELGKELRIFMNNDRLSQIIDGVDIPKEILFLKEDSKLFFIEIFYRQERDNEIDEIWFELYDSLIV